MYKRFFIKILLIICPFLVLIITINFKVDTALLINNRNEEIASCLLSGKNYGIKIVPTNREGLQIAVANEMIKKKIKKDILVFGTSRSSEINSKMFPRNSFFNCVVPGGNILDYIALYGLYKQKKLLPKYLIISIDPWTFHSRKARVIDKEIHYFTDTTITLTAHRGLEHEYYLGLKYLNIEESRKEKTFIEKVNYYKGKLDFFSLNYFQNNLSVLFEKFTIITDSNNLRSYFVIRSDGSYSIMQQKNVDTLKVLKESVKFIDLHKSNFFITKDTSTVYFRYFEELLVNLKKDGVIPVIYISPINPVAYKGVSNYNRVAIENKINWFCKKNSIKSIGSFNPENCSITNMSNLFVDAFHPVKEPVENIFRMNKVDLKEIGIEISTLK